MNESWTLFLLSYCTLRSGCHCCFITTFLGHLGEVSTMVVARCLFLISSCPTLLHMLAFGWPHTLLTSSLVYWAGCMLEIAKKGTLSYKIIILIWSAWHWIQTLSMALNKIPYFIIMFSKLLFLQNNYYFSKYFKVTLNHLSNSPSVSVLCKAGFVYLSTVGILN